MVTSVIELEDSTIVQTHFGNYYELKKYRILPNGRIAVKNKRLLSLQEVHSILKQLKRNPNREN